MTKTKESKSDQSGLFVKAAKELECDDDEAAFDRVLKKIATAPQPKSVKERKTKKASK